MAEKILNARLQLKYDQYSNWQNSSLILKKGEIAIATIPQGTTADGVVKPPAVVAKVGDGSSTFAQLPWLQGPASDVHDWAKAANKPAYTADEISGLADYIAGEIEDTDTQYKIVPVADSTYKFNLMAKGLKDADYTMVSEIDLSAVGSRLDGLETKVGEKAVSEQISDNNASLAFAGVTAAAGQVVKSVSQANGVVSAELKTLAAEDIPELAQSKITGLKDALNSKQDNLTFDGDYNAATNKVATVSTVSGAIGNLNAEEVAAGTGEIISKVSQTNGVISVEKHTLTKKDIPTIDQAQVSGLETALSGKQDNLAFTGTYNSTTNPVALKDYVDEVMADVNGAMHFRGAVTGDTFEAAVAASGLTFEAGDVVLWGVEEHVYDGAEWHVLGNESIYALKSDVNDKISEIESTHKSDIEGLQNSKQDNLTFDGEYNSTSNKVATVSTVNSAINTNNASLKNADAAVEHQFVTAAVEANGIVTVSRAQPVVADISGLQTELNTLQSNIDTKQDALTFDGTYNAASNKAATVSTVSGAIANLKNEDAAVDGSVVVEAKQTNGVVSVVRKALAAIAWSGSTDDLVQGANTLVINCGDSTTVI